MGQKPIDESRQMASKIKVVKIGQYTVFPRGVVSFFNYRGIVNAYEGFQRKMTDKRAKMCEAQHTLSSLSIRAVLDVIARVRPCH